MAPSRRLVLAAALVAMAAAVAVLLSRVLATVFFAVTVAYVLVPVERALRRNGLPRWWASATATLAGFVGGLAVFLPIGVVLYLRRRQLIGLIDLLPDHLVIEVAGFTYGVDAGEIVALATGYLARLAIVIARATPVLAVKATVLGFVVFALLLRGPELRRALLAPVPPRYHDIVFAIHGRVRSTLFALYVIQAATALGTFAVSLAVFWVLGYEFPVAMAAVAGVLQFLPVIGPSLLVVALAAFQMSQGAVGDAALVLLLGLILIGFLPDAVLRPRLARETARLPSSLYFVGFTGGLLSLGPVGIIAGPLVVAILVEVLSLLVADMNRRDAGTGP